MKLINRVFSFLLISCALGFMFYLLSADNFSADVAFIRPSYYQAESTIGYFPAGGMAALIGIISCLFAWFKVRHKDGLDKEELYEQTLRQRTITNDITSSFGEQQSATSKYMETIGESSGFTAQDDEAVAAVDDDETVSVNDDETVSVNDEPEDISVEAESETGNKEEVL